jgi:maltose O-acetyltransferase
MKVFLSGLIRLIYKNFRRTLYRILSDNKPIIDKCVRLQPVITAGEGKINLHKCVLGYYPSEKFWSGYCHIEARSHSSEIVISDNVFLNNDAVLVAERSSIIIEADCLIGPSVRIYDSDFHNVDPRKRIDGTHKCAPVHIGRNVFIGAGVTILKGATIGKDSVIAAGSVVTKSIPPSCIAAGNPAVVIKKIVCC